MKGAVVVVFCQNEADVKYQMDIEQDISLISEIDLGGNVHLKFYICLILAEGDNNCSF